MKTAHILQELRLARNMSQTEIAKALGIDRTTYVKYEHGGSIKQNLPKLADFFQVSTDYLLGRTQTVEQNEKNSVGCIKEHDDTVLYDVISSRDTAFFTEQESVLIQKYRHLKPEHQRAIDIQVNYFYGVDSK
ncbi:helix-turn-helix domain-containing protein [Anaerovibrio sp.]|uniref:helix-turn-helix domain-containing protein n=1 Tax=Anaerovibrio sp. TaxID=1872532 RepID=UPI00388E5ACD